MANVPAFIRPLVRYADFQGRSRRAEFWSFYLLLGPGSGCLYAWLLHPSLPLFSGEPVTPDAGMLMQVLIPWSLCMIAGLALFLPPLAVQVRRLHDSNRTGWWIVLPAAASTIGQSLVYLFRADEIAKASMDVAQKMGEVVPANINILTIFQIEWPLYQITMPYILVSTGIASLIMLVLYLWPGTKGGNRFGADPRH